MIQKSLLLTKREANVINKKLMNKKLTQQDSNYLSRYVRPKLREMSHIDSRSLLRKLEYNQKVLAIEKYIKNLILKNVKYVSSITIYGSVIYNNYRGYNDIDVLVTVKRKSWRKLGEKYRKIITIKNKAKKHGLKLDIEIYSDEAVSYSYPSNPSLIYQLKDSRTIYGALELSSKIEIPKLELRMKLDYSYLDGEEDGLEIYKAIRNLWLVKLILNRIVNNLKLNHILTEELGENVISRLKSNRCSKIDKKIASLYLDSVLKKTEREIVEGKWEKIVL